MAITKDAVAPIDASQIVEEIKATVAEKKKGGQYPAELMARIRESQAMKPKARPLETIYRINSVRPLGPNTGFRKPIIFVKKVIRRAVGWYVQPMAIDMSAFNESVVREIRALQSRLDQLETPWWQDSDLRHSALSLNASRRTLVERAKTATSDGPILVLGKQGSSELYQDDRFAMEAGNPVLALKSANPASLAGIIAFGVLPALTASELTNFFSLAASRLAGSGLVVTDAPVLVQGDPSSIDLSFVRWIAPETMELLCEAAHLKTEIAESNGWYSVVAKRSQ